MASVTAASTRARAWLLRIATVIVTIASALKRFRRGGVQLVRSLLPFLAVVVAGVRRTARSRSRLVKFAAPLLVGRPLDESGAGVGSRRVLERFDTLFEDFVQLEWIRS